jgi:peptide/nickel transport system substrate-binding protein
MSVPSGVVLGSKYTLVPNPYFYDKQLQPWSKIVDISIPTASSMLEAMQSGEIDVAVNGDPTTLAAARKAGFRVVFPSQGGNFDVYLDVNRAAALGAPALTNLQVRQAMNYAIDRPLLAKTFGSATPTDEIVTQYGFDPKYQNYYKYNVAKAKALLAAAGYPNGFTFKLLTTSTGLGVYGQSQMEAVASMLAKVGITMTIVSEPIDSWGSDLNNYPAAQCPCGLSFMSTYYGIFFGPGSSLFVNDPTIDSLEVAASTGSAQQSARDWLAIGDRIVQQAYFLPTLYVKVSDYQNTHKVTNQELNILLALQNQLPATTKLGGKL